LVKPILPVLPALGYGIPSFDHPSQDAILLVLESRQGYISQHAPIPFLFFIHIMIHFQVLLL